MATESTKTSTSEARGKTLAKFTGSSVTIRRITAKEWKAAGIDGMDTAEWSPENQHSVDISAWSQEAKDLLAKQPNFKISEG